MVDKKPEGVIFLQRNCDWACSFCRCQFDDVILQHPVNFRCGKLSCRWHLSIWCTVHFSYASVCKFNLIFRGCNTPEISAHMSANISKRFRNYGRYSSYKLGIVTLSHHSLLRKSSSVFWTVSWCFIRWRQLKIRFL